MITRIILLFFPFLAYAQLPPPPSPPGLPIDGMTGALLLMGVVYGYKKIVKDSSS